MFSANGRQKPHKPHSSSSKNHDKTRLEEYRKAFSFFDANNDGFISADELNEAMRKCGQNPSRLELKLIMFHGDLDQNGVITFDEFTHLMDGSTNLSKYTYAQLLQQFQMFDRDRDGFIEKHEMYECVKELSLETSFPSQVIEQLFSEADVDGDGKISFDGRRIINNEVHGFRMNYRAIARLRQTCHDLNDIVHGNSDLLRFPIENANLMFEVRQMEGEEMSYLTHVQLLVSSESQSYLYPQRSCDPRDVECAIFDRITVYCFSPMMDTDILIKIIKENNIQGKCLQFCFNLVDYSEIIRLYATCSFSALSIKNYPFRNLTANNMPFNYIEQLSSLGCKKLKVEYCDQFPPYYPEVLSTFESVTIRHIKQTEQNPLSLAPIIQRIKTDEDVPLRYFNLAFEYYCLKVKELDELGLEMWRFDVQRVAWISIAPVAQTKIVIELQVETIASEYNFIVRTSRYYIIIHRIEQQLQLSCMRFPRENVEEFVLKWAEIYMREKIPYDISGLYEYVKEDHDNYDLIRTYMTTLVEHAYSYDIKEHVRF